VVSVKVQTALEAGRQAGRQARQQQQHMAAAAACRVLFRPPSELIMGVVGRMNCLGSSSNMAFRVTVSRCVLFDSCV